MRRIPLGRVAIGSAAIVITGLLGLSLPAGAEDAPAEPDVTDTTVVEVPPTLPEITVPPTTAPPVTESPVTLPTPPPTVDETPTIVEPIKPPVEQLECRIDKASGIITIPDIDGVLYYEHGFLMPPGEYLAKSGTFVFDAVADVDAGYAFDGDPHVVYSVVVREVPKCEAEQVPGPQGPAGPAGPQGPPGEDGQDGVSPGGLVPVSGGEVPALQMQPATSAKGGELPRTGSSDAALIPLGAGLVLAGGVLIALARRRLAR